MSRFHYLAALLYSGFSLVVLGLPDPPHPGSGLVVLPAPSGTADVWFLRVKPYCNVLEADLALRQQPPPNTLEGTGYAAACLALAGKIDEARDRILSLPAADRYRAASIVFEIGHPVADAGDDRSAGPIMALVVEFWPNHYMALYHAGMAHWSLNQREEARTYLRQFLQYYDGRDGWYIRARDVLKQMEEG